MTKRVTAKELNRAGWSVTTVTKDIEWSHVASVLLPVPTYKAYAEKIAAVRKQFGEQIDIANEVRCEEVAAARRVHAEAEKLWLQGDRVGPQPVEQLADMTQWRADVADLRQKASRKTTALEKERDDLIARDLASFKLISQHKEFLIVRKLGGDLKGKTRERMQPAYNNLEKDQNAKNRDAFFAVREKREEALKA